MVIVVEVVRSTQILESLLVLLLLLFNSELLCLLQQFCFIGNLLSDAFGWWPLLDVIFLCWLTTAQVLLCGYFKLWDPEVVGCGWFISIPVVFHFRGRQAVNCLLRDLAEPPWLLFSTKPQVQEKFSSPINSLLVFLRSGTPTTVLRGSWQLCLWNSKWQNLPSTCHFPFFVLGLTLGLSPTLFPYAEWAQSLT